MAFLLLQVACFDTAFHTTIPEVDYRLRYLDCGRFADVICISFLNSPNMIKNKKNILHPYHDKDEKLITNDYHLVYPVRTEKIKEKLY